MPEQLTRVCGGVRSASNTSLQLVPNVFDWVQTDLGIWKAGENLDDVVGEELCDVVCCLWFGFVTLKYSATQRLMPEIKYVFIFERYSVSRVAMLFWGAPLCQLVDYVVKQA